MTMKKRLFTCLFGLCAVLFVTAFNTAFDASAKPPTAEEFAKPTAEYKPWVYWFWNNGNITREGITADLEAMARTGIGGVLIMEVGQGAPAGPVDFLSDEWRELFRFMIREAARLGIEVNMNNDAGWNGSGGKWITPEHGMQVLTWSQYELTSPWKEPLKLSEPPKKHDYYRDIVVWAFPTPTDLTGRQPIPVDRNRREGTENKAVIERSKMIDLTDKMAADGTLDWTLPEGKWTLIRLGHTCKGRIVAPAPTSGAGLECDKLSVEATDSAFNGQIGRLVAENKEFAGKIFVSTHIDSWENGSQNWTPLMRTEFQNRRNYDLLSYLPIFAGYIVENTDVTDRFLWDFRRTVSEMVMQNHVRRMSELAHKHGLKLSIEAYGSPCDHIEYGGLADEPMGEFWIGGGAMTSCRGMASAGHIYGRPVIGAEAFTATDSERWLEHPGSIKVLGDQAFAEGINRFVFHRYSFQPWKDIRPGLMMGPWGIHYERTQTWWELTPPWHEYLSRCQFMLRQGRYVADICYVEPEESHNGFTDRPRNGYPWDQCGAHAVGLMSVEDGKITLPSGMRYEILVLQPSDQMTSKLLKKVTELVRDGATVIASRPGFSYGLEESDQNIRELASVLWGDSTEPAGERTFGKGRIIWGKTPESVLNGRGIEPDVVSNRRLTTIHRRTGDADIYFVANPLDKEILARIDFRAVGTPEIWHPETGRRQAVPMFHAKDGVTRMLLPLGGTESVFVVISRTKSIDADPVVTLSRDGKPVADLTQPFQSFNVERATYGVSGGVPDASVDVTEIVRKIVAEGAREIATGLIVRLAGDPKHGVVKTLTVDYTADGKRYSVSAKDNETVFVGNMVPKITILNAKYGPPGDEARTIDVRELLQRILDAGENRFRVARLARRFDPAHMVLKTLEFEYEIDGKRGTWSGDDGRVVGFEDFQAEANRLKFGVDKTGKPCFVFFENGKYEAVTASGKRRDMELMLTAETLVSGSWQVSFPEKETVFDRLISWSDSPDDAIKYFSGTATYRKEITLPETYFSDGWRIWLDLGQVDSLAELSVNGKPLGVLWKLVKTVDVTDHVKPGGNTLEIRVTNLWPNRLIGDDFLPPDAERRENGTLPQWPQWLLDGKPYPDGRQTFCMWNLWSKKDPLISSGLIGPVRFVSAVKTP